MSCNETKTGAVNLDGDCKCERAVMRAYKTLRAAGLPDGHALEAAKIVYSHHHPEDSKEIAGLTVERWVNHGHFH